MTTPLTGLSRASDSELRRLLRAIHRDELPFPITRAGLIAGKFGHLEAELEPVIGRDKASARAVVAAVLAERARAVRGGSGAQLIWSGPPLPGAGAREPSEVVQDLVATAERELLVAGFSAEEGHAFWRSVHAAMLGRELNVIVALDASASSSPASDEERAARAKALVESSWPYRDVRPRFFYASRHGRTSTTILGPCIVADEQRAAVWTGGFDFEEEAPHCIRTGIMVDDASLAAMLSRQWKLLIEQHVLRPVD